MKRQKYIWLRKDDTHNQKTVEVIWKQHELGEKNKADENNVKNIRNRYLR